MGRKRAIKARADPQDHAIDQIPLPAEPIEMECTIWFVDYAKPVKSTHG